MKSKLSDTDPAQMMQRTDQIEMRKIKVSDAIFMAVKPTKTLFPPFVHTFCFTMNNIFSNR